MVIFDSVKKEKVPFVPIRDREVRMYVCGPTVYDDAHLGHARSAIAFDLLRRTLMALGYHVTFARNFTDIDDKIIKKSLETGQPIEAITKKYTERYLNDMHALGVLDADISPRATTSLNAIVEMVEKIIENGCAYQSEDGTVWFDTSKDAEYCSLSHRCSDEEEAQARIEHEEGKRHPRDFALWKACKENDVCYDSPFGRGRPGWHIECSAMIDSYLAYKDEEYAIDIHGGGADLFFPHHENEAAQTRCATHQKLAKYWMHNGFVNINGEKMSKSLGNSFFVKDALRSYDGEILRFYLLSTHYRANFNFNEEDLLASKKRLDKLYRLKKRLYGSRVGEVDSAFKKEMLDALSDDLNISRALASVDEMVAKANESLDANPKDKTFKQTVAANIEWIDGVLGIGGKDAYRYFQLGMSEEEIARINERIEARNAAKKERDFETADAIRAELAQMGIQLMDTPQGTVWEKSE
ncbi:cysteine--tRNA ligase [Hydrogenimonas urashimensis]|uniref:cysteine--tRNA ligase n=1 Tax=Hydrogenimonas urashimensis TaxID=2740515 RepID=UPI0019164EAE|nr:cysteine--tRNA ligase [Hydrogenimonas urashimensis]